MTKPASVDSANAIKNVMKLLSVPGVSCDEKQIASTIASVVRKAVPNSDISFDSAHKKSPYGGNCGNLVIKIPGAKPGPRRLLIAHMDTVPICRGANPVRNNDVIQHSGTGIGVGADNRSGCGALLTVILELRKQKLSHPPLTFLFTVQEEIGLVGARFANIDLLGAPKIALNLDGGAPEVMSIGATGGFHLEIDVKGIPAHAGGQPEQGVSAAVITALAIADLHKNGWFGLIFKDGVRGTSNIGVIQGGKATNVVMDHLHLVGECRSYSMSLRTQIADAYKKAFQNAVRKVKSCEARRGSVDFTCEKKYEAFKLSRSNESVRHVARLLRTLGMRPKYDYSNGGLDANWLAEHGISAVTIGAGSLDAHTGTERLAVDSYLRGCQVALNFAAAR